MAKQTVTIEVDGVPDGYEVVAFRLPLAGDEFIPSTGVVQAIATRNWTDGHRLIVREIPKKPRPYNAAEMRAMHRDRVQLRYLADGAEFTAVGFGEGGLRLGAHFWTAEELQSKWTHLDGTRCEVVE